ncbi:MAG: TonB-dependent receptor [Woeseiaceae bacterium]|nr:TonB-dependent receptor [Woeseiaceae bacterium]
MTADESAGPLAVREQLVSYGPEFFARYQPVTALDMVRQVPGFTIDNGSSERGFIAAVGNILINGVYPSAKQDSPSSILARIPADQVTTIERIRGQVRDIDLQGQPVVVNVVLQGDYPAVVRWDLYARHHTEGPLKPGVDLSLSDRWGRIDYNAGVRIEREANGETGNDRLRDADGALLERADVIQDSTGIDLTATLNASALFGGTLARINSRAHYETRNPLQRKSIFAGNDTAAPELELIGASTIIRQFEVGADGERSLTADLDAKAILLYSLEQVPQTATRQILDADGNQQSLVRSRTTSDANVAIARVEFDHRGLGRHHLQFNAEAAFESLDGTLVQTEDTGDGPVEVDVPGANTRVEEIRGDFLVKDTWTRERLRIDLGLGAEVSRLTQTGDARSERDFFFLKPEFGASYAVRPGGVGRLRLAREVAQLDFDDFITATVLEDDDLNLGNENLEPDRTWIAELGYEWRPGPESVFEVTVYHHWIEDVLDLLPLSAEFEAPGNIGDGRRWGLELEGTLPLDRAGLDGAKLDMTVRLEDSSVVDPVTGRDRVLSGETGSNAYRSLATLNRNNRYFVRLNFRQDLPAAKFAWGWTVAERDERPIFRVNELDRHDEGYAIDVFVETTRWRRVKVSVVGDNLLNFTQSRDRTRYVGERGLTPVEFTERRERFNGRRITLTLSGTF